METVSPVSPTTNDYLNAMKMLLEMYNVYQLKHIQMKPPTYVESDDEDEGEDTISDTSSYTE